MLKMNNKNKLILGLLAISIFVGGDTAALLFNSRQTSSQNRSSGTKVASKASSPLSSRSASSSSRALMSSNRIPTMSGLDKRLTRILEYLKNNISAEQLKLSTGIADVKTGITGMGTTIGDVKTTVENNANNIGAVKTVVDTINTNSATAAANTSTILGNQATAATQAATDVASIKGDIGAVKTDVTGMGATITGKIGEVKTIVENNATNIGAVKTVVDTINTNSATAAANTSTILGNQATAATQAATDVTAIKGDIAGISSGGTNTLKLTGFKDPAVFADIQRNIQPSGMTTNLYTALKTLNDRGLMDYWRGVPTIYSSYAVGYLNLKLTGYEPNEIANRIPDNTFIGSNTTIGDIKTHLDEIVSSGYWSLSDN